MTLYRRGDIWWSYVWVRGVRHAKSTKTSIRRLAEEVDREHKHELVFVRQQAPQLNPDLPFAELAATFIANAGPKPWHLERLKILLPYFGDLPIGRITRSVAREYRFWRHRQKKVTETTVNRDLECLRHLLFFAVDEGLLATNPLSRVVLVRERRKRRAILSVAEEELLLNVAAPHLHRMIIAALDTGMRRGEITHQRWEDVDFARELLSVTHSKTPEGEAREIPFTRRLFNLLWEMREDSGLIFTFEKKSIQSVKRAWKTALRRSGIRPCRFHDLRHTFNCRLLESGTMQEIRKALMGHSSGEDVHATYVHVELPQKREAIRKLELWMESQRLKSGERNGEQEPTADHRGGDHPGDRERLPPAG